MAISYALAAAFYPSVSSEVRGLQFFEATYFGCIGASVALSAIALCFQPGLWLYMTLFLRGYVLIIMGYSIGAFLSTKLLLGLGFMAEIGVLVAFPYNLACSGLAIAVIIAAQSWPEFFGQSGLVEASSLPSFDQLVTLGFVLAAAALASAWITRADARRDELSRAARLQEANLEALAELNLNLQGYARTVDEESAERERNRISREIHDISGYIFTNLIALMDAAGSMPRDDQAGLTDILITARKTAQEGLRETRSALRKLRGEAPPAASSPRAIFKIVSIFRKITGIEVDLSLGNMPHYLAPDLNLALYRTVQEGLTNAVRHGKATRVRVSFWVDSHDDVLLSISDNGKGAFEVVKGIGLTGMDERIGALGGTVSMGRAPEGGFSLSVKVPLKEARTPQTGISR